MSVVDSAVVAGIAVDGTLLEHAMIGGALAVVSLALLAGVRVIRGPTLPDRVVAVNGIGTATVAVLAFLSAGLDEPGLLDVALVYALLNFLLSIGLARYAIERGGVL